MHALFSLLFLFSLCFIALPYGLLAGDQSVSTHPTTDPFAALSGGDKQYVANSFSYAFETIKDGETYSYKGIDITGNIAIGPQFKSHSNATCRRYSESYNIKGAPGTQAGVGCKRDSKQGWCRLRETNALTCAMEPPQNFVEEIQQGGLSVLNQGQSRYHHQKKGWFDRLTSWWD